jgi:hypothetical protein
LAAGLLGVAGATKVARPRATAQAMRDAGLPGGDSLARTLGGVELAAAAAAVLIPGVGALALSVCYLAFAGFLAVVLRRPSVSSCGCAGARAVPPSRLHLAMNLVAAASGVVVALVATASPISWLLGLGAGALPVAGGLVLAGWLAIVAVTEVPAAVAAWRPPDHEHPPPDHDHRDHHVRAEEALARAGIGPGHPSLWPGLVPPEPAP